MLQGVCSWSRSVARVGGLCGADHPAVASHRRWNWRGDSGGSGSLPARHGDPPSSATDRLVALHCFFREEGKSSATGTVTPEVVVLADSSSLVVRPSPRWPRTTMTWTCHCWECLCEEPQVRGADTTRGDGGPWSTVAGHADLVGRDPRQSPSFSLCGLVA